MLNDGFVSGSFMQIVRAVLQEFRCEERDFNLDRVSVKALDLLNHTQTLEDAMSVCKMYGILHRNEEIIKRMLVRQRAAYNMVEEDNYYILARAEKNEAYGIYYVTNAMRRTPDASVLRPLRTANRHLPCRERITDALRKSSPKPASASRFCT